MATGLMLLALPGVAGSANADPEFGGMPQPEPDCVNSERRTIASGGTNGVTSVFAIDLNGDGDVDVLSASTNDDTIAWHENDGNDPPSFTRHIISTNADGASSVFAADLDGDGDVDVVSA
ncbi:MAG: FG-GAP-like repeat-containing protein, partial [Gemmatimonadota bacterium]